MRLINTRNLRFKEFTAAGVPEYAILSHRWGKAEASFTEWQQRFKRLTKFSKDGFTKILSACKRARQDGLSYVWVDTVCIDKSSSAELSEAINSMFSWYRDAKVCYVYLDDVPSHPPDQVDALELFRLSKWFTRGWTLQELLAPDNVLFFTREWLVLGTKKALASSISQVTGIDQLCLSKEKRLGEYSIAQRMCWAADRSTTREEDIAYSLLGIFNINMPLLYGEGKKAFKRLQEEITKASDDHSILTFDTTTSKNSLLADHPSLFRNAGRIQPRFASRITPPFQFTNAGLSLTTPLIRTLSPFLVLAVLNCFEVDTTNGDRLVQICLPLLGKDNTYMRARDPVCLIRMPLQGRKTGLQYDLATPTTSSYLVAYFTRVYPAFGAELDHVMKDFEDDDVRKTGFMLTFPRGMGSYRTVAAYPPGALQEKISLFSPHFSTSNPWYSHGLIVFEECLHSSGTDTSIRTSMTEKSATPQRIGIYLAQTDDFEGCNWMCRLIPNPDADLYEKCNESWPFEADPTIWNHYDHLQNFIVAARTQLAYSRGPRQVVLVEMVFDADVMLREISSPAHNHYFDDGYQDLNSSSIV
ncbi:HET-domain-containing protein [Xylariaceae sp. FL1651]|nr:HET-domain-containing protein [Xylariaceae sp. FL1651]